MFFLCKKRKNLSIFGDIRLLGALKGRAGLPVMVGQPLSTTTHIIFKPEIRTRI
jgi:hypothetical protein